VVSTVGGAVYTDASSAVSGYCALAPAQRAVAQLVVAGKVYNSGLCDIVNGDTTLDAQLTVAAQEKAAELINDAIAKAVANGRLTQEQADVIQSVRASSTPAPAIQPAAPADNAPTTATSTAAIGERASPVPIYA
jgi:glucokinase